MGYRYGGGIWVVRRGGASRGEMCSCGELMGGFFFSLGGCAAIIDDEQLKMVCICGEAYRG